MLAGMGVRGLLLGVLASGCWWHAPSDYGGAPPDPSLASSPSEPAPADDPAECVDPPVSGQDANAAARAKAKNAVQRKVAELVECAPNERVPINVQAIIAFRTGGTVEEVLIKRAATKNCQAIECAKKKLAEITVTGLPAGRASLNVSFALRKHPPPDAAEELVWDPALDSKACTDTVSSPQEPELIQAAVRAEYPRVQKCYELGLARNPRLSGKLSLRVAIDARGKATNVNAAQNEIPDCEVVTCVKEVFRSIAFPPSRAGVNIVYPLLLQPG